MRFLIPQTNCEVSVFVRFIAIIIVEVYASGLLPQRALAEKKTEKLIDSIFLCPAQKFNLTQLLLQ